MPKQVFRSRVAAVSAGALLVVGLGAGGAVAADKITSDDISNFAVRKHHIGGNQVGSFELRRGAIRSNHLADNTVRWRDLRQGVQSQLNDLDKIAPLQSKTEELDGRVETLENSGPGTGSIGSDQIKDGSIIEKDLSTSFAEELGSSNSLSAHDVSDPVDGWGKTVKQIGGSIGGGNDTKLANVTLQPGTYMVNVDGAFMYPEGTTPHADGVDLWPQLSLWVDEDGNEELDWDAATGGEGSISPNALMPNVVERHITVSGTTLLTITKEQAGTDDVVDVHVSAFGYDSDQGQAGEGQLQVNAELTVTEVDAP